MFNNIWNAGLSEIYSFSLTNKLKWESKWEEERHCSPWIQNESFHNAQDWKSCHTRERVLILAANWNDYSNGGLSSLQALASVSLLDSEE